MRITKKISAIALSILMAISMMPFTVFAAAPKATVEEITAPEGMKRAYKFTASTENPTDYDSYHADFEIYFNKDIKAGEVTLYGKYGEYDWTPVTIDEDVPHGQKIRIIDKFLGQKLTYAEIRDVVSPFYCGINTSRATDVNAVLNFKLYEVNAAGNETGVTTIASDTMGPYIAADPVPKATITEVTSLPQGVQRAFKFEAPADKPTVYDNYHADFVLTFRKDIKAGEVILWGKYGQYDWTPIVLDRDVAKGESVRLVDEFLNQKLTYAEIRDNVGTFYCGLTSHSADAFNVDVELKLFPVNDAGQESGTPLVSGEKYPYIFANPLPTATVTEAEVPEGAAFAYKFTAPNGSNFYDGYHADFVATFDKDVKAGEVTLYGKYGQYDWTPVVINRDIAAGEEFRIVQEFLNDTLTYGTVRNEVSPFYCGAGGAVLADVNMNVELKLFAVDASGAEISEAGTSAAAENTIPASAVPQATVTTAEAPEDAAFAYKFTAPAGVTAYDSYKADFVATFDRDVKAGEVTLYGKYGQYDWTPVVIDRDVAAGEEFLIVKEFLNDTLSYATIRDEVSPFYCAAGGDVLADTNMSVQLKLFNGAPAAGEGIAASETVTDDIAEELPKAIVNPIVGAPEGITAYSFAAPHSGTEVDSSKYKNYRCDFVVTFDKDIAEGDVTLCGNYGNYGWVDMPAQAFTANTEYRILKDVYGDTLTYATICKEVSPFLCGYKGAAAEETGMKVELRFYKIEGVVEVPAGVAGEVETTIPAAVPVEPAEDKFSITVKDEIDLNVYVAKTADVKQLKVTSVADFDEEESAQSSTVISGSDLAALETVDDDGTFYKVRVPVAPAQIRDAIKVEILDAAGSTIRPAIEKTVAEYCEDVVNGAYTGDNAEQVEELAATVLDYGRAAAIYFGYNADAFANQQVYYEDAAIGDWAAGSSSVADKIDYVTYRVTSVPELRFYFKDGAFTEEEAAKLNVQSNIGEASFVKLDNGTVLLQVTGIPASRLGEEIQISGDITINYTPLRWAAAVITHANADSANLVSLANAVINYSNAAAKLFA